MERMSALMTRLGLEVNTDKTRIARLPEEPFDFLGYTVGRFYGKDGRPYIGTRPSRKAVKSLLRRIHERTSRRGYSALSRPPCMFGNKAVPSLRTGSLTHAWRARQANVVSGVARSFRPLPTHRTWAPVPRWTAFYRG